MIKMFHVVECGDLTGCGKMVAAIAGRLDPAKFDVTLVYSLRGRVTRTEYEALFPAGMRKIYMPQMGRQPGLAKDLSALFRLWLLFLREKPDAVHLHSSKAGFLGRMAAFFALVPRVFYSPYGYGFRMTDASVLARRFYYLLEKVASLGGYIVGTSPHETESALKLAPPERVIRGYNGIDVSACAPAFPEGAGGQVFSVACGRIAVSKRPESLVRLAARVRKVIPGAKFCWIGSGTDAEMAGIRKYAAELGADNLVFTGWVSDSERDRLLRSADIFVHYSAWDALPLAVTEAMTLGKPVLASEAVEQVLHGESGFIAQDEEALFRYFLQLAGSPELRAGMGRRARSLAENNYNIDALVKKLSAAYSGERIETVADKL